MGRADVQQHDVITFATPVPIVDGSFAQTIPGGPGGIRGQIEGMFVSDRLMTGAVSFMVVPIPGQPSCSGAERVSYRAAPG